MEIRATNINKGKRGRKIQFFFILSLLVLVSSCRSTKFIEDDQALVRKTTIKVEGKKKNLNHLAVIDELENLIQQPVPGKFLGVSRDYYDLKNQGPADTTKIKRFVKRFIAEKHQIFDTTLVAISAYEMQKYLQNKRGYYDASVSSSYKVKRNKTASTIFDIELGEQFKVDSVFYRSNNPEIQAILDEIEDKSNLQSGSPVDAGLFETEKERIFQVLQNRGYANFLSSNIKIKGDSSEVNKRIDVLFDLSATAESNTFQKYHIGKINVYTDFFQDRSYPNVPSTVIRGKNYYSQSKNFVVNPRSIDRQIFIKSGDEYNRSNYYSSIKQLSSLSTYKFVKLSPTFDTANDTLINYDIYLTPHNTKYSYDYGTNTFYSTTNKNIGRRLVGFAADGSLIDRNLFGGSEKNETNGEAGLELQIASQGNFLRFNAINFGLTNVTTVPRQVDYLGIIGLIYSLGDISRKQQEQFEVATNTSFYGGWNYQDVLDLYRINTFTASIAYTYTPNNNWKITLSPTGFDLLDYSSEPAWKAILCDSPRLLNSFRSVVFSGFFFKEVSAIYDKPENINGFSWSAFGSFELSGGEIELANIAYNAITNRSTVFKITEDLTFARFAKLQLDWRATKKLNDYSSLAGRLNFGIAKPFSNNDNVPYISQFFAGGPISMRAWQARELGPGSFRSITAPNQRFFQTGDLQIEANIEYRSDLFWIIEYALFMDAGNVWTIGEDVNRPGTQLTNIYEQLAVGWGWGLRLDFSYFMLRFDFAYKLKNPYLLNEGTPLETYFQSPVGQGFLGNPTIAINYPF